MKAKRSQESKYVYFTGENEQKYPKGLLVDGLVMKFGPELQSEKPVHFWVKIATEDMEIPKEFEFM